MTEHPLRDLSVCEYQSKLYGYMQGCRCDECRSSYREWKRDWRAKGGGAVERDREASRRWKREHLGQPGKAA